MNWTLSDVIYPPGGAAEICSDICDFFEYKINNHENVVVNTAVQLNCKPHIGTITTFMCAFALAEHIKRKLNYEVSVMVDFLENAPYKKMRVEKGCYAISLSDYYDENTQKSISETFSPFYYDLANKLSEFSEVSYNVRTYEEFQSEPLIRRELMQILEAEDKIKRIVNPKTKKIKARVKCPICKNMDFDYTNTSFNKLDENTYQFSSKCYIHGEFNVDFSMTNKTFISMDTSLRDITKSLSFIDNRTAFTVMMDGGDWGGAWALRIHGEVLATLGYKEMATRFFAPIIMDWSGAKFSKSVYLKKGTILDKRFCDYEEFLKAYGIKGLSLLWNEVREWIKNPNKFFRNYSIDFIKLILSQGEFTNK